VKSVVPTTDYADYTSAWNTVARAGLRELNIDAWAVGRRYLSLATICLGVMETVQLRDVTQRFSRLLDVAVDAILRDPDWWSALAWPWPAIELARREPPHPGGLATLFGRFDCLLDTRGCWQIIEYNADTPSGGREATGLEPAIARLHATKPEWWRAEPTVAEPTVNPHTASAAVTHAATAPGGDPVVTPSPPDRHSPSRLRQLRPFRRNPSALLGATLVEHLHQHPRPVRRIGIVSSHSWLEDMAQAVWLARLLGRAGLEVLVGDVTDLALRGKHVTLRGEPIDALYRFYPVERLYRHAIFAGLCEAAIDGRLLMLNGLRGFLAQSKACLAWLWWNRASFDRADCAAIERHLPETVLARDPDAARLLRAGVVKHVNGREGDSVAFGADLTAAAWESRLIEGGYVVQRAVSSVPVVDVEVDDLTRRVEVVAPRYACVGAFVLGGKFGGCYTRLDGPITSARATYAATLLERPPAAR
jgi:glutathionylspermidine synthase